MRESQLRTTTSAAFPPNKLKKYLVSKQVSVRKCTGCVGATYPITAPEDPTLIAPGMTMTDRMLDPTADER